MTSDDSSKDTGECVVWLDLNSKGYPWWPCKVNKENNAYISFWDNMSYEMKSIKPAKVREYNHKDLKTMVEKGKNKLRNRRSYLEGYCEAIAEAVEFIQSNIDESFQDPSVPITPIHNWDRSIFTHGSDSSQSESYYVSDDPFSTDNSSSATPTRRQGDRKRKRRGKRTGVSERKRRKNSPIKEEDEVMLSVDPLVVPIPTMYQSRTIGIEKHKNSGEIVDDLHDNNNSVTAQLTNQKTCPDDDDDNKNKNGLSSSLLPSCTTQSIVPVSTTPPPPPVCDTPPPHSHSSLYDIPPSPSTPTFTTKNSETAESVDHAEAGINDNDYHGNSRRSGLSDSDDDGDQRLDSEDSSSSEDESELPSLNLSATKDVETLRIRELKPSDVIWVKYTNYPFWPALVIKVKVPKKKPYKSTTNVIFFGYNDVQYKVSNYKNISRFWTKHEDYSKAGLNCKQAAEFKQALKEATDFIRDRADGKFPTADDPKLLFKEVMAQRPKDYNPCKILPRAKHRLLEEEGNHLSVDAAGQNVSPNNSTSSSESENEKDEESQDEEDPIYTYDRVMKEVKELEPTLIGIMRGAIPSEHHRVYEGGSNTEKSKLRVGAIRGPLKKRWKDYKVVKLIQEVLLPIAREEKKTLGYVQDVLLPEAMVRVKEKVENISFEQALEEFEN